ncbi:MAG: DUF2141 domain-containing protein [Ignavibacteriaceae bacterium]
MISRIVIISIILCISTLAGDDARTENATGTLIVNILGFKSDAGKVKIAVANSMQNYKDHKNPFRGLTTGIKQNNATVIIEDIPFGEYALKAFHDEDSNDELTTNFLGIPVEAYGFSNDAREMFGPPAWDIAKFKFDKDTLKIEITIK